MPKKKRRTRLKHGTNKYGKPASQVSLAQPSWDMGPDTEAQRAGKVIEDARIWDADKGVWVNPNGVKRARRIDLIESWANTGKVTERQFKAAQALRIAFERTMCSAPAIKKVQVDTSPRPDETVAMMVDRIGAFADLMKHVPSESRAVVECVVLDNRGPNNLGYKARAYARGVELLRSGLDAVADELRL
ncbi:hypothetical protein [Roseicyclus sp.]|uniref:hypothetical protein n=1 Tax=Roseicyclus sp. TaxID=1914329 RepID=UPI003F6BE0E7